MTQHDQHHYRSPDPRWDRTPPHVAQRDRVTADRRGHRPAPPRGPQPPRRPAVAAGSIGVAVVWLVLGFVLGGGTVFFGVGDRADGGSATPAAIVDAVKNAAPGQDEQPGAPSTDPYEVYLQTAPAGAPELSREDAQTRAYLGCGQAWAPGTVDAALADAYAELCAQQRG